MATKLYKSPVDGTTLAVVPGEGDSVRYRDRSTGVEYSAEYAKENFKEVKLKTQEQAKKAAERKTSKEESGPSGASGPEAGASGASGAKESGSSESGTSGA